MKPALLKSNNYNNTNRETVSHVYYQNTNQSMVNINNNRLNNPKPAPIRKIVAPAQITAAAPKTKQSSALIRETKVAVE